MTTIANREDGKSVRDKLNAELLAGETHRTSNGSDHLFIDQDVTSGSAPTFTGTNISAVPHNAGASLQGGAANEYYHLTSAQHAIATDAFLTSIAALGTAADKMLYTTGADTAAETPITAAGRALLDDATAGDQRVTLGFPSALGTVHKLIRINSGQTAYEEAPGIVDNSTATTLTLSSETTPVNYFDLKSSATGNAVTLSAQGSDTNVGITFTPKGSLGVSVGGTPITTDIFSVEGTAKFGDTATAYPTALTGKLNIIGSGASGILTVNSTGTTDTTFFVQADANNGKAVLGTFNATDCSFTANNTERIVISSAGVISLGATAGSESLRVSPVASAVNYLQAQGATTGNAVTLSAQGSDTDVDMALTPKGAGLLKFGTHSAIGAETLTGYITIKDTAGNSRKVGIIS